MKLSRKKVVKTIFEESIDKYSRKVIRSPEGLIVNQLAMKKEDVDKERTPLIGAVELRELEIVDILLKLGADPNKENKYGETPLWILAKKVNRKGAIEDDREIAKMLIDAGADLEHSPPGEVSSAKYLLKHSKLDDLVED